MALTAVSIDGHSHRLQANTQQGKTYILPLTKKKQTFLFEKIRQKPILSFLRGFSAPVKVIKSHSPEEQTFLVKHDNDPVNRWDALQSISREIFLSWFAILLKQPDAALPDNPMIGMYADILSDDRIAFDLKVALLSPPSLTEWVGHLPEIQIDIVEEVYRYWVASIAKGLVDQWVHWYDSLHAKSLGKYVFEPKAIALRTFKNLCLWYASQTGYEDLLVRSTRQYQKSQHMTDTLAALRSVAHLPGKPRTTLLGDYEERWQDHPLAMNKWFAIQAQSFLPETLSSVKALTNHPKFSWQNPNNVYSLLNTFGMQNLFRFHEKEGDGYVLMAESVLKLDVKNPQVAARLMQGFMDWKKYDAKRKVKMEEQLKRILKQPGLSKDVLELVDKYLK